MEQQQQRDRWKKRVWKISSERKITVIQRRSLVLLLLSLLLLLLLFVCLCILSFGSIWKMCIWWFKLYVWWKIVSRKAHMHIYIYIETRLRIECESSLGFRFERLCMYGEYVCGVHKNYIHAIDYICWTQKEQKKHVECEIDGGQKRRKKKSKRVKEKWKTETGKRRNLTKTTVEWEREWWRRARIEMLPLALKKMMKKRKSSEKPYVFIITIIIFSRVFFCCMCRFDGGSPSLLTSSLAPPGHHHHHHHHTAPTSYSVRFPLYPCSIHNACCIRKTHIVHTRGSIRIQRGTYQHIYPFAHIEPHTYSTLSQRIEKK